MPLLLSRVVASTMAGEEDRFDKLALTGYVAAWIGSALAVMTISPVTLLIYTYPFAGLPRTSGL